MANSGQISCNGDLDSSFPGYSDCKWVFQWTSTQDGPGKTKITYDIYPRADDDSGHSFAGYLEVYVDDTLIKTMPNDYYKFSKNSTSKASGSFTITHNNEGKGSFKVTLKGRVYSGKGSTTRGDPVTKTFDLDENMPYEPCYWDANAKVSIDESLQKPGGSITISWSGAKAKGTANPIAGFEVYYSLDNGTSWNTVSTSIDKTTTSTTMEVPENRGSTISAKVVIKNTQTSFTNPSKTGGSCKINSLPGTPSVFTSGRIIPSTQNTISFAVTAGSDDDGQACSIKYATQVDGEKSDYTSGTNITINESTTYYFWTWDGYEWGKYTSINITKNTKPTVTLQSTESKFNRTLKATKEDNGQNSSNSYYYGFKYNNEDYKFTEDSMGQDSYEVGDIRHWISQKVGGLSQNTTYEYQYWVQRYDGIEYSDKVYLTAENFTTRKLTLITGRGPTGYFGTNITVSAETGKVEDEGNYYPTGLRSFSSIERGQPLTSIDFKEDANSSQSFDIKLASPLTRVREFDFFNLTTPNSSNPFKPYSQSHMTVTMAGRDTTYGFSKAPQIRCGSSSIGTTTDSSNDLWKYSLPPNAIWDEIIGNGANDSTATFTKDLTITNEFGENFTYKASFSFDFRETPTINNFSVFNESTDFIKEGSELTLNGTITYYNKGVVITIKDDVANQTRYSLVGKKGDCLGNPWSYNSDSDAWIRTGHTYDLSTVEVKTQPTVTKQYTTTFTIDATCVGGTESKTTNQEITVLRHTPPRIRFTKLEYNESGSQKILSGYYIIDDLGYDLDLEGEVKKGKITEVYMLGPDKDEEGKDKRYTIWQNNSNIQPEVGREIEFTLSGYDNFTEYFRNLYPICDNELWLSKKTTENFEYLIVYNILPTIAYRQNYLGINTKDPSRNGVTYLPNPTLTIGAYNEHKYIYLTSANKIASIDLEASGLNGFVIDAGSWDQMGPIDVTNKPQDLQIIGLAPIAYTGEVRDLEQEENDTIIISGGSSTDQI